MTIMHITPKVQVHFDEILVDCKDETVAFVRGGMTVMTASWDKSPATRLGTIRICGIKNASFDATLLGDES